MADVAVDVSASLESLLREFDIVTHNIANASTTGYKRQCATFSEALGSQVDATTDPDSTDGFAPVFDFSQGPLTQTGRNLDLALFGNGFFVIETPDGPLYTRNGMFQTNQNGQIVDAEGRLIAGEDGPLVIPMGTDRSQIAVSSDGTMQAGAVSIGRLRIVCFPDAEDDLLPVGGNCWRALADTPPVVAEETVVRQGYREGSNVKLVDEMVNMIAVTRAYEANVKFVNVSSDTTKSLLGVAMI